MQLKFNQDNIFHEGGGQSVLSSRSKFTLTKYFLLNGLFNRTHRHAFTLAEVLITLGIIGIVAAITLPGLIDNYQKQVTANQLKKTYSVLNQALQKSLVDNGGTLPLLFVNDGYGAVGVGETYLIPQLNVVSKFSRGSARFSGKYKIFLANGNGEAQFSFGSVSQSPYAYILKDGTLITFTNFSSYSPMGYALYILVDLNGLKKPNRIGRDVFVFTLSRAKPNIISTPDINKSVEQIIATQNSCPKKGETIGYQGYVGSGCATIIMKDGWKIKDHYPWW